MTKPNKGVVSKQTEPQTKVDESVWLSFMIPVRNSVNLVLSVTSVHNIELCLVSKPEKLILILINGPTTTQRYSTFIYVHI